MKNHTFVIANRRARRCGNPRSPAGTIRNPRAPFLRRLHTAWLVLVGKIPFAQTGTIVGVGGLDGPNPAPPVSAVPLTRSTLTAVWWCREENLPNARAAAAHEVGHQAEDYAIVTEEPCLDGGYNVTATLYLYEPEHTVSSPVIANQ